MKATGEVMAMGRTYEESLLKAIRSLEYGVHHLGLPNGDDFTLEEIIDKIKQAGEKDYSLLRSFKTRTKHERYSRYYKN